MNRLLIAAVLAGIVAVAPQQALGQSSAKLPRVGILFLSLPSRAEMAEGFEKGMRELGYVDGKNVIYELRDAGGRPEQLAARAADLVRSKVDVILTGGPGPFLAARKATDSVPIVTVGGSDPVAEGWARSLARPGANMTGLTVTFPELSSKRLELLKEMMPSVVRVGVLFNPDEVRRQMALDPMEAPARRLGMQLQALEIRGPADFERVLRAARQDRIQAILTQESPLILVNRSRIAELAVNEGLPWIGEFTFAGVDGLVLAYGADITDLQRRAASHIDRILKGARPGDLPIERPTKFDLTVNLKTARMLGITVPRSILLRADRVIE
ncbi:MAG: ABC transporter substrate-binding protein [Caldimonas sp.]